ncbi:glycosyltransferase family 2 protein [Rubrivirga sp.]|uniref:glycosyltransferase family 2 protein n=1 Tax=Rubrivirga sp. TaxID=1885344 RepID=UPI003C781478
MASLVSVLIPAYNVERYVGAALDSLLAQTYPNVEVIVVNDGSTDGTRDVLKSYEARGVRVINQANAGAAAARNRALAESTGTAVLFLDGDDWIGSEHLARLAARLEGSSSHVAMGQWARFLSDPAEAVFPHHPSYRDANPVDWIVSDWTGARPMTQSGMFLIPRVLLDQTGGWDERLSLIDDFEFFARVIAGSDGVRFALGARLHYRSGLDASLSGRKSRAARESQALSLTLGTHHLLEAEDSPRTRRAAAHVLQDFVYDVYPEYPDLRHRVGARVEELGGSDLEPSGPPGFHRLRRFVGWRLARRVERFAAGRRMT